MRALSISLLYNSLIAGRNLPPTSIAHQLGRLGIRAAQLRMEQKEGQERSESNSGWEKRWEQGLTPWDLRQPTPIILHLHQTGSLPKGRAFIPGCGSGYDVVAIACPERFVVGLDISDNAIKKAKELSSSLPNANHFTFLKADFFTWRPTELFDLIFDYTFFCAIEPEMRSTWAKRIQDILKPDGELITLMFPISDHVGGPPYKVSISDYEEVLHPMGFKAISIVDNELAVGPRKGREKLGRWERSRSQSFMRKYTNLKRGVLDFFLLSSPCN